MIAAVKNLSYKTALNSWWCVRHQKAWKREDCMLYGMGDFAPLLACPACVALDENVKAVRAVASTICALCDRVATGVECYDCNQPMCWIHRSTEKSALCVGCNGEISHGGYCS